MTHDRRVLEIRERHFDYDHRISKYFDSGNVVLTAEWNALALIIPPGEIFFIRSVKRLASQAKDPGLQCQIKGFIGQEAMHSKETNRSLEPLARRGFPVNRFQAWYEKMIFFSERFWPAKYLLAATAACEHYTAILSIWHLGTQYSKKNLGPGYREIAEWHGAEELEHKSVAFDLLQEVAPHNYFLRVIGFVLGIGMVWLGYRRALRKILKFEHLNRAQLREERRQARRIRFPLFNWRFPHLWDFLKPGFHPSDLDESTLSKKILAEQAARAGA